MAVKHLKLGLAALLFLFTAPTAFGAKKSSMPIDLSATLKFYQESKGLVLEVNKSVKNTMLDKETNYPGLIQLADGKFHWETTSPDKNLLVFDGSFLWNIQYPPEDFKSAPLQVAKMSLKSKNSPLIILEIFGSKPLSQFFGVTTKLQDGDIIKYALKEKKMDLGLKNIILTINKKDHRVVSLSYVDELENETILSIKETQLDAKLKTDLFSYKPPKGAQVTEY
ncbi:MAG: outer rane lipoprotein carrier protein [Pseudomonadota bacterium]